MKKKHKTRLSAQTMCFFSITHPVYTQVFLRTLADVSVSDMLIASYSLPAYFCRSSSILYCNGAHRPALRVVLSFFRGFAATSDKVRWREKMKNSGWRFSWRFSGTISPEELREDSWSYRFLRWYRKCCCLSVSEFSIFRIVFSKVLYIMESQKFWTESYPEEPSPKIPLYPICL